MLEKEMDSKAIEEYVTGFGRRFLRVDLLEKYFEIKIIPKYLKENFPNEKIVLDLGCGTGLYFWASFLPSLERLDGIDLYQEFINEADRVINLNEIPEGYRLAHEYIGENFTIDDLYKLKAKRGIVVVGDFRKSFPESITTTKYDLITEFGSIAEVKTNAEFIDVVKNSAQLLKSNGAMMFVQFLERNIDLAAQKLGRFTPDSLTLNKELFDQSVEKSGMKIIDFHPVELAEGPIQTIYYGFARKQ